MRIEIVANRLSDTDQETGIHHSLSKGDVVTVPDSYGQKLCGAGWAKDVTEYEDESERVESAPFTPGAARLKVNKLNVTPKGRV